MVSFTWSITQLTVKPQEGPYTDMVIVANWQCNGVEGSYTANTIGAAQFTQPGTPFTPYDQLTQSQVLDWCWATGVDKATVEAGVAAKVALLKNPPAAILPLPWAN